MKKKQAEELLLSHDYTEKELQEAFRITDIDWKANALQCAKHYLDTFSTSYRGLIKGLQANEEFTEEEAVFAADNCGADWKQEALKAAERFTENNGQYSYEEMLCQLSWFDFTREEAEYAAKELQLPPDKKAGQIYLSKKSTGLPEKGQPCAKLFMYIN